MPLTFQSELAVYVVLLEGAAAKAEGYSAKTTLFAPLPFVQLTVAEEDVMLEIIILLVCTVGAVANAYW